MRIIISFFFTIISYSQNGDYLKYHQKINKAEQLFFMENKIDSSLYYYDEVFSEYDFIFVKDIVNAAQIAIFSKKEYRGYIEQAFEYGLKISHLKNYPLFKKEYIKLTKDGELKKMYQANRKKYISKIDFKYLDWIYKTAIKDQESKHLKKNYSDRVLKTTNQLIDSVLKKGFAGEKLIGLSDSTIYKEINKPHLDLYFQRKKNPKLWYMTSDEQILAQHWPLVILVHNPCSYYLYKKTFLDEIRKGNIHPRDVALIHDNMYRFVKEFPSYCNDVNLKGVYGLNLFTDYTKFTDKKQIDDMRKLLYIVPTKVDEKKREFENKYGFKLFSGFWNCR